MSKKKNDHVEIIITIQMCPVLYSGIQINKRLSCPINDNSWNYSTRNYKKKIHAQLIMTIEMTCLQKNGVTVVTINIQINPLQRDRHAQVSIILQMSPLKLSLQEK